MSWDWLNNQRSSEKQVQSLEYPVDDQSVQISKNPNPDFSQLLSETKTLKYPEWTEKTFYVYILSNLHRTLYTGVTNDILQRMAAHKQGTGSKFCQKI